MLYDPARERAYFRTLEIVRWNGLTPMPPVPGKGSIDAAAFANSHASLSAPLAWLISAIFLPHLQSRVNLLRCCCKLPDPFRHPEIIPDTPSECQIRAVRSLSKWRVL